MEKRTENSISIKQTFSVNRGYNLIFEDAKQIKTNQIRAIRGFIQQDVDYIVFSPVVEDGIQLFYVLFAIYFLLSVE